MKKRKTAAKHKLNFFRQSYLTDVSWKAFTRALPYLHECMPRIHFTMTDHDLWSVMNGIVYLSVFYCPWGKVENFKTIQRCYYSLKHRNYLGHVQKALGLDFRLDIRRPPRKKKPDVESRRRKCPECPSCGHDTMICQGTRHQGFVLRRYYRCQTCGYTALWITTNSHQWWRKSRPMKKPVENSDESKVQL